MVHQNVAFDRVQGENPVLFGMENNQTPQCPLLFQNWNQKHFLNHSERLISMSFSNVSPIELSGIVNNSARCKLDVKQFLITLAL